MLCLGFLKFLKRDKSKELDLELEGMEDLDMPPMPPDFKEKEFSMEKEFERLPELPELPEGEEDLSGIEEEPLPELELPEEPGPELKFPEAANVQEFPESAGKQSFLRYLEPTVPKPAGKQSFPRYLEPTVPKLKEGVNVPMPPPRPIFGIGPRRPLFGWPRPEEQKHGVEATTTATKVPKPRPEIRPYERFERAAVEEERAILKHKEAEGSIYIRADKFGDIITGTSAIKNSLKLASQAVVKLNEIDIRRDRALEKWKNVMIDLQKKLIFMDKTLFKR